MSQCNRSCERDGEPHPDCVEHGEVAVLRARVAEVERERDEARAAIDYAMSERRASEARVAELEAQGRALSDIAMQTKAEWESQRAMTVHRLGGMVEGAPTHAGNFLQRVDALREIERAALSLMERMDFWRRVGTLPGEYDNLRDALEPVASAAPATEGVTTRLLAEEPVAGALAWDRAPSASGGDEARRSSPTDVTNVGCERCSGTGQVSGPDKKVLVCAACGGRGHA